MQVLPIKNDCLKQNKNTTKQSISKSYNEENNNNNNPQKQSHHEYFQQYQHNNNTSLTKTSSSTTTTNYIKRRYSTTTRQKRNSSFTTPIEQPTSSNTKINKKLLQQLKQSKTLQQYPLSLPKIQKLNQFISYQRNIKPTATTAIKEQLPALQKMIDKKDKKQQQNLLSMFLNNNKNKYKSIDYFDNHGDDDNNCLNNTFFKKSKQPQHQNNIQRKRLLSLTKINEKNFNINNTTTNTTNTTNIIKRQYSTTIDHHHNKQQIKDIAMSLFFKNQQQQQLINKRDRFSNLSSLTLSSSTSQKDQQKDKKTKSNISSLSTTTLDQRRKCIYFNSQYKKKYFKDIVDKYFPNDDVEKTSNKLNIKKSNNKKKQTKYFITSSTSNQKKQQQQIIKTTIQPQQQPQPLTQQRSSLTTLNGFNTQIQQMSSMKSLPNSCIQCLEEVAQQEEYIQENNMNQGLDGFERQPQSGLTNNLQRQSIIKRHGISQPNNISFITTNKLSSTTTQINNNENNNSSICSSTTNLFMQNSTTSLMQSQNNSSLFYKQKKLFQNYSYVILLIKRQQIDYYCQSFKKRKFQKQQQAQQLQKSQPQSQSQSKSKPIRRFIYEYRKYYKNDQAMRLMQREIRATKLLMKMFYDSKMSKYFISFPLWQQDRFQRNCLKLNLNQIASSSASIKSTAPTTSPLTLFKALSTLKFQSSQKEYILIKPNINPNSIITQEKLLQNSHKNLLHLIRTISSQLKELNNRVINNRVCLSNIILVDENRYAINEWGSAEFRQFYEIQNNQFQSRLESIYRSQQSGYWFAVPEYLAPEVLQNINKRWMRMQYINAKRKNRRDQVNQHHSSFSNDLNFQQNIQPDDDYQENDLFKYGNVSDVWSLGLMIVEIILMVPVWIGDSVKVQGNTKINTGKGLLHTKDRKPESIMEKQKCLKSKVPKKLMMIESQTYSSINPKLIELIMKMLQIQPDKRISFEGILEFLDIEFLQKKKEII